MVRSRKLCAMASMLGLVASMLAVQLAFPGAAQARCAGVNNPVTSTLIYQGRTLVSELPATGACNNNRTYTGHFRSHVSGWYASVWIQNNGVWSVFGARAADTDWWDYDYIDSNSNSLMSLCLSNVSPVSTAEGTWRCGWGGSVTNFFNYSVSELPDPRYYGTNQGF